MATANDSLPTLLGELKRVLEDERQILLAGNPERITAIAQCKLTLAEVIEEEAALPGSPIPSIETLTWLARYNRQNAAICSAMLRHLTQAIDRLRRHEPHRSYKPDGSESSPPAAHTLGAA
jgi:flagellar biosynthesis/type III secretory pathway chaperone